MIVVNPMTEAEVAAMVDKKIAKVSHKAWSVMVDGDLVLMAGVARTTMLGEGELWLIVGPFFRKHYWPTLRSLLPMFEWVRAQYPKLIARVEPEGKRLCEFVGMEFVGWSEWPDGRCWRKYA